ncbi:HAMP domain-containing protein [bacterium]|nr:HAMP domain-containing protein [candidate division CSSED10-310 bacterium]
MFKFITDRIGVKVALIVNLVLLIVIAGGSFYIVENQSSSLETQLQSQARLLSIIGAQSVTTILEEAVDNGVMTVTDIFDQNYVQIPGLDPPKYHTKYDFYFDKALLKLQDRFLADTSVRFAVTVDTKGYLPTHNSMYQKPLTGDPEKDLLGNRTKRVFNDPVGIKAAQNTEEGFLQVYQRDTGETMWDVSTPIFVKGRHWGGFRIGYSIEKTIEAKNNLRSSLFFIMLIILLISIVLVFVVVSQALKPLGYLTVIAGKLADGEVDQDIKVTTNDEIGKLANVLERLRLSLKSAMDRLRRK